MESLPRLSKVAMEQDEEALSLETFLGHLLSFERILRLLPTAALHEMDTYGAERALSWAEYMEGVVSSLEQSQAAQLDDQLVRDREAAQTMRRENEDISGDMGGTITVPSVDSAMGASSNDGCGAPVAAGSVLQSVSAIAAARRTFLRRFLSSL